jgi:hypothetical protein
MLLMEVGIDIIKQLLELCLFLLNAQLTTYHPIIYFFSIEVQNHQMKFFLLNILPTLLTFTRLIKNVQMHLVVYQVHMQLIKDID